MKTFEVALPELAIVAATRAMGGAGAALLLSNYLQPDTRRTLGWTLLGIGVLSTIPIAMALLGHRPRSSDEPRQE